MVVGNLEIGHPVFRGEMSGGYSLLAGLFMQISIGVVRAAGQTELSGWSD